MTVVGEDIAAGDVVTVSYTEGDVVADDGGVLASFVDQAVTNNVPPHAKSGDHDGDGKTDVAIFRPSTSTWWILNSSTGLFTTQQWGTTGDTPLNRCGPMLN